MKKSNPILNLFTVIFASIGGCAAVLSGFIILHSVFVGEFSSPDGTPAFQEAVRIQSSSQSEDFSEQVLQQAEPQVSESAANIDMTAVMDESVPQSLEEPQAETSDNSIPLEYYEALNRANTYSDTMHMLKADIYDRLVSEDGDNFSVDAAQYAVDHIMYDQESDLSENTQTDQGDTETASNDTPAPIAPEYDETAAQTETDTVNVGTDNTSQSGESAAAETPSAPETEVPLPIGTLVWLSRTGEKYHRINNCGNMNPSTARQVTLEEAVSQGYGQCKNCY